MSKAIYLSVVMKRWKNACTFSAGMQDFEKHPKGGKLICNNEAVKWKNSTPEEYSCNTGGTEGKLLWYPILL